MSDASVIKDDLSPGVDKASNDLHRELIENYQSFKRTLGKIGQSRLVSLAHTKVDEAYLWAKEEVTKHE